MFSSHLVSSHFYSTYLLLTPLTPPQSVAQRSKAAARSAKDVSKCVRVLEDIEQEAAKLREVSTAAKARRAAIARLQAETREVDAGSGIMRRQVGVASHLARSVSHHS